LRCESYAKIPQAIGVKKRLKFRHWRLAGFLRLEAAKMEASPAHTLNHKSPRNAPFRAQSVIFIYGEQPHLGLFGAHCSPERSRLLGNSLQLLGISCGKAAARSINELFWALLDGLAIMGCAASREFAGN
jgi:hypothetical protein